MNIFHIHKLDAISDRTKHAPATDVLAELSSVLYAIEKNPKPVIENTKTTNNENTSESSTKKDENNENKKDNKEKEENKDLSISIFRPYFVQPEGYKKKGKRKISDVEDKDKTSSSTEKGKEKGEGKAAGKTG